MVHCQNRVSIGAYKWSIGCPRSHPPEDQTMSKKTADSKNPDAEPKAAKPVTGIYVLKVLICFLTFGFVFSDALNG